jgi:thiol-disulfide isomerase/thioredoxin
MKRSIAVGGMLAALLCGAIYAHAETSTQGYPPAINKKLQAKTDFRGKPAPFIKVKEWLSGSAPDTRGKVVLLDFWATWCGDCTKFNPELNQYKKKFGNDLAIIGVTYESESDVKKFMMSHPIDYDVALAPDREMYNAIGVIGIPHCLVISADGIVRWQGFPQSADDPLTEAKLAQIIKYSKWQQANVIVN